MSNTWILEDDTSRYLGQLIEYHTRDVGMLYIRIWAVNDARNWVEESHPDD